MNKVAEVLEGLREEERRLSVELSGVRRAIAALQEVMGIVPAPAGTGPVAQTDGALPPHAGAPARAEPSGPYEDGGFYESVAAYLTAEGEPRTAQQIAEGLQAGGYPTRARNFRATARTMLNRSLSANAYGIHATDDREHWFLRE